MKWVLLFFVRCVASNDKLPVIDIHPLLDSSSSSSSSFGVKEVINAIGKACEETGFFYITNHGVSEALQQRLDLASRRFFSLPMEAKREVAMAKGGKAWRGYFSVGEEVTSGLVDQKEGLYFGQERDPTDPRPLHGANLFPGPSLGPNKATAYPMSPVLRQAVLEYIHQMTQVVINGWGLGWGERREGVEVKEAARVTFYPVIWRDVV
jgi:isopenicillin N synthase-like dioxygenase